MPNESPGTSTNKTDCNNKWLNARVLTVVERAYTWHNNDGRLLLQYGRVQSVSKRECARGLFFCSNRFWF